MGEDLIFVSNYLQYAENLIYVDEKYKYTIEWPLDICPESLGSTMRSPEDFFYNQTKAYEALLELSRHSNFSFVRSYAAEYILGRPIDRILAPYLNLLNKNDFELFELMDFFNKKIIPVFKAEKKFICQQKGWVKRLLLWLMVTGKTRLAFFALFLLINKRFSIKIIKKLFVSTQPKALWRDV